MTGIHKGFFYLYGNSFGEDNVTQEELDAVVEAREKRLRSILIDPEDPAEGLVALFEAIRDLDGPHRLVVDTPQPQS